MMNVKVLKLLLALLISNFAYAQQNQTIGQRFILTLPETSDHKFLSKWLAQTKPAGVMLLASHFRDRKKTKQLTTFLQAEAKKCGIPQLIIAVDWEGGIVSRPNEAGGFHSVPSPWALAQVGRQGCFMAGMLIGHQLKSVGVTMNFAPSLDLFDDKNYILATRCYSSDPRKAAEYGIAFAQGLLSQGVIPVIKHFPGLGLGSGDTHITQVEIDADDKAFKKHLYPFVKALQEKIPAIMCTHAKFKFFGDKPVTMSKKAVQYIRSKNPDVLLITDDFSMKAAHCSNNITNDVLAALHAGYDYIIFSGKPSEQVKLMQALEEYSQKDISSTKQILQPVVLNSPLNEQSISAYLARTSVQSTNGYIRLPKKNIVLISCDLAKMRTCESWFCHKEESYLARMLINKGFSVDELIVNPKNPDSTKQVKEWLLLRGNNKNTHFMIQTCFYADNIWNRLQQEWLEFLKPFGKNVTVISLGHPYEHNILPEAQNLKIGSFHKPELGAAADLLTATECAGADVFMQDPDKYLRGKQFGLLCHKPSVTYINGKQQFLPDALVAWAKSCKDQTRMAALFSPEHGLLGAQGAAAHIASESRSVWGCPVYSLHGEHKKPTPEMLKNLDVLVVDLQDVGVRCFTYLSTLKYALEAAAENDIDVILLDRSNPLELWGAQGPEIKEGFSSFVGAVDTQFLTGLGIGTIAQELNEKIGARLTVIPCQGKSADILMHHPFIPPSPALKTLDHVFAYPLTVFFEGTNYSEGRGTEYPFLQVGAPWVNSKQLAQQLNKKALPGIYFEPVSFIPKQFTGALQHSTKHQDKECHGVFLHITDYARVKPIETAQLLLRTLFTLYPKQSACIKWGVRYGLDLLVGSDEWRKELQKK